MGTKKRELQDVEENVYRPLKEARMKGSAGQKQVSGLCKVGKKHGLHRELLSIAPAIFRKELEKRQTFDRLVLQNLGEQFEKHVDACDSKKQGSEQLLQDQ